MCLIQALTCSHVKEADKRDSTMCQVESKSKDFLDIQKTGNRRSTVNSAILTERV